MPTNCSEIKEYLGTIKFYCIAKFYLYLYYVNLEESRLQQTTGDYLSREAQVLAPTFLDYKPVTHANRQQLHKVR